MRRINNFKPYFSKILSSKYCFTKEGIDEYWRNRERQEAFDNKKIVGTCVGLGELLSSASLCIIDNVSDVNCVVPIIILGGLGALTTKFSVTRNNPYCLKKYREIDKEYELAKIKYKKDNRKK